MCLLRPFLPPIPLSPTGAEGLERTACALSASHVREREMTSATPRSSVRGGPVATQTLCALVSDDNRDFYLGLFNEGQIVEGLLNGDYVDFCLTTRRVGILTAVSMSRNRDGEIAVFEVEPEKILQNYDYFADVHLPSDAIALNVSASLAFLRARVASATPGRLEGAAGPPARSAQRGARSPRPGARPPIRSHASPKERPGGVAGGGAAGAPIGAPEKRGPSVRRGQRLAPESVEPTVNLELALAQLNVGSSYRMFEVVNIETVGELAQFSLAELVAELRKPESGGENFLPSPPLTRALRSLGVKGNLFELGVHEPAPAAAEAPASARVENMPPQPAAGRRRQSDSGDWPARMGDGLRERRGGRRGSSSYAASTPPRARARRRRADA